MQPIGRKNRKGSLGSYYAIADYRALNPEFGTESDVRSLVNAAHRQGMKVILDWVPNHSAFDHPWITQHKDYYVTRADGTVINARDNEGRGTDWTGRYTDWFTKSVTTLAAKGRIEIPAHGYRVLVR